MKRKRAKIGTRLTWRGFPITIETPRGTRRRPEWPPMGADYGEIRGTMGADGDPVDVFVGPDTNSDLVVVVDQVTPGGRFDEHKVLIGFSSRREAVAAYRQSYTRDWRVGPVTVMTVDQFRIWLGKGDQQRRISTQVSRYGVTFSEMVELYDSDEMAPRS